MLREFWHSIAFHSWWSLACLATGLLVTLPLLLHRRWRRRITRSGHEFEAIGLTVLIAAIVALGAYNRLGPSH